jgi:hypothetical protein
MGGIIRATSSSPPRWTAGHLCSALLTPSVAFGFWSRLTPNAPASGRPHLGLGPRRSGSSSSGLSRLLSRLRFENARGIGFSRIVSCWASRTRASPGRVFTPRLRFSRCSRRAQTTAIPFQCATSERFTPNRAHALLPTDLMIETNRAHALMFLERGEDCKALYLAHKGKPISGDDGELWEGAIVEDYAKLRSAGLTHPMMADIEEALGASR